MQSARALMIVAENVDEPDQHDVKNNTDREEKCQEREDGPYMDGFNPVFSGYQQSSNIVTAQ